MSKININGTSYDLTMDAFNITFIDGRPFDEFVETLSIDDQAWLAKRGLGIVVNQPDYFEDIASRIEMPKDQKEVLDKFKPNKES